MPRGDRTGPQGEGPRTGRGKGYCSGSEQPGYKQNRKFAMSRRQNRQSHRTGHKAQ